jgi:hypothetical protein
LKFLVIWVFQDLPRKATVMEVKRNGGAFQPFHREKSVGKSNAPVVVKTPSQAPVAPPAPALATPSSSAETATGVGSARREEKESQGQRKQRRNWSPELHRRFVQALQQLGGSHGMCVFLLKTILFYCLILVVILLCGIGLNS